jgi:tRNA pseudouridine32 synthase/23S rRNA pseudouridine746 synthase
MIPPHLCIRILHEDASILVIDKPCNLRSVPGNIQVTGLKRCREERMTAQEAWIEALSEFHGDNKDTNINDNVHRWAMKLANSQSLVSIPRKLDPFLRYFQKNLARLLPEGESLVSGRDVELLGTQVHDMLAERQRSLLNIPPATRHEDSAFGQLILLGYSHEGRPANLFVVHRIDCETSGVMVFARTQEAASFLGKAWRERDQVTKTYVARVKRWPPYEDSMKTEGIIELPLSPSKERLKWKVDKGGKPCKTMWKIRKVEPNLKTLDLTPVTGRTHQLRIHLAEVGSGIDGDSLYGDNPETWDPENALGRRLNLHAEHLSFPHPETTELMDFSSDVSW